MSEKNQRETHVSSSIFYMVEYWSTDSDHESFPYIFRYKTMAKDYCKQLASRQKEEWMGSGALRRLSNYHIIEMKLIEDWF